MRLPARIEALVAGCTATPILIGKSKSEVFRFDHVDGRSFFLKVSESDFVARELEQERRVLAWLRTQAIPAPEALALEREGGSSFFLLSAVPGRSLAEAAAELGPERCLIEGARFLRRLHSLPTAGCPFPRDLSITLRLARENLDANLVDETDFDGENLGTPKELLYASLLEQPPAEDLVFTHGDYCFPNIIVNGAAISGVVDLGRAGVADRYQDLALFLRSFSFNTGAFDETLFLREYGLIRQLNPAKLAYFRRLDEFF